MRFVLLALAGLAALSILAPAVAHHSFSAEFDVGRPVDLTGTVSAIEWTNPHAWLHLDVESPDGQVETWAVEMLGVISLARRGFSSRTVKVGDRLTITGFGSRDGTNTANASTVTRTDTGEALWVTDPTERN
jgi:hypothetical protein